MTATGNFMRKNVLFWLTPILLLVIKLMTDFIPYKSVVFGVIGIVAGVSYIMMKKAKLERSISATRELEELEDDDEDYSNYGEKSMEDRKKKIDDKANRISQEMHSKLYNQLRKEQSKQDRKLSKLKQNKNEKNERKKKYQTFDSDMGDNDENFLKLGKK